MPGSDGKLRGAWVLAIVAGVMGIAVPIAVFSGVYNVAGDTPHTGLVYKLLETVRTRSVARHAANVVVPADLGDAKRIAAGASEYAEMCSQCHRGPGMEKTEISQGLYPGAPEFARGDSLGAAEQFWVVKHGIKFTAMPAWGQTHSDDKLWNLVAFVRKLPSLSAEQYKTMTAQASEEHGQMMQDTMPGMKNDHP